MTLDSITEHEIFNKMRENYLLAKKNIPENFKSKHWDFFYEKFDQLIETKSIWKRMLRNSLTIGFNDNLIKVSNQRFLIKKENLWTELQSGSIMDLIQENNDEKYIENKLNLLNQIIGATDLNFVLNNSITNIGNPVVNKFNINYKGEKYTINFNDHDAGDLYHAWLILLQLKIFKKRKSIICEIGGGYGGLISKIKSEIKDARVIMLDLPEVNASQTYYLSKVFHDKIILGYKDFLDKGIEILKDDFDFLILPGWIANQLPKDSVDAFINIRSMMEMNRANLDFYFQMIQNSLKVDGIFACFNRYQKLVGEIENKFIEYPFDDDWKTLLSQHSIFQPHIHQLILKRLKKNSGFEFRKELSDIEKN